MAEIIQIQIRRDTAADWTTNDPTLAEGEFGYETDTGFFKIGDGVTAWTSLTYNWFFGGQVTINSTQPELRLIESDGALDQKNWFIDASAEAMRIGLNDDAFANEDIAINIERSGTGSGITVDSIFLFANAGTIRLQSDIVSMPRSALHMQLGAATATFPKITRTSNNGGLTIAGGSDFNDGGYMALFGSTHATAAGDVTFGSQNVISGQWDESAGEWLFSTGTGGSKTLSLTIDNPLSTFAQHLRIGDTLTTPYTLSVQNSGGTECYIEILNSGGAGEGVFFGLENFLTTQDFALYNWQGGPIIFYTDTTASSFVRRYTIEAGGDHRFNSGNLIVEAGNFTITGNVLPNASDLRDLGSTSLLWRRLYLNDFLRIDDTAAQIRLQQTNGGVDQKWWFFEAGGERFRGQIYEDALVNNYIWLNVERSGTGASVQVDTIDLTAATDVTINSDAIVTGKLQFDTELQGNTTTVTGTSFTADDDWVILVDDDTAGSAVTITLPAASGNDGLMYIIKKLGTTANVIVDGNASETIDGATTFTLTAQYAALKIICDGSNWHII